MTRNELFRRRLIERFDRASGDRVLLVVASAGYGKSTALRHYLDVCERSAIRFNVRLEHRTLVGFVRGFCEAFQVQSPTLSQTFAETYERCHAGDDVAAHLAAWAGEQIGTYDGIVAVDDMHLAQSDPQPIAFLRELIARCPSIRWIICTRTSAGLPVGTWSACGDMTVAVDESDLAFTIDEAERVCTVLGETPSTRNAAALYELTRGWPTALAFACRSSVHVRDIRKLSAVTREAMYRYLSEQVYAAISEDERDLLRHVAYLPDIDFEVLSHAGFPHARRTLEELRSKAAFITVEFPARYACHDLFVEFLKHVVEADGPLTPGTILVRLAQALEKTGRIADALRAYSAASAQEDVLRLLHAHALHLLDRSFGDVLEEVLQSLPSAVLHQNAIVLGLRGLLEVCRGRIDKAEKLLRSAVEASEDTGLAGEFALRLAVELQSESIDVSSMLQSLTDIEYPLAVRANATAMLAFAHARWGRVSEARATIDYAERLLPQIDDVQARARMLLRTANAGTLIGVPAARCAEMFSRAYELAMSHGLKHTASSACAGWGVLVLMCENDVERYVALARRSLELAEGGADRGNELLALLHLVNAARRAGDEDEATVLLARIEKTTGANKQDYVLECRAMLHAWHGDFSEAHRTLSLSGLDFCDFDKAETLALRAFYAAACGDTRASSRLVTEAIAVADSVVNPLLYAQIVANAACAVCAIAEVFANRPTRAANLMRKRSNSNAFLSALWGFAERLIRVGGSDVRPEDFQSYFAMLDEAKNRGLRRVLEAGLRAHAAVRNQRAATALTDSEIAVVRALSQGDSPKSIAAQTGRSVHTVRTLAQRAAEKLGASGRQHTIALARARGLIDE